MPKNLVSNTRYCRACHGDGTVHSIACKGYQKLQKILSALASVGNEYRTALDLAQILSFDIGAKEIAGLLRPLTFDGTIEKTMTRASYSELKYRLAQP